jgi:hypothetical protein
MIKIFAIILVLILLVLGGGYFLSKQPQYLIEIQLLGKNVSNPSSDAEEDLKGNILRCYSINGFGPYFPGVERKSICKSAIEVNFVGTSDAILSTAHGNAISKAINYASKYNEFVASHAQ